MCGQVAAAKKRKAEEASAREAAEVERRECADADDRAAAQQRALDLRQSVAYHREGASTLPVDALCGSRRVMHSSTRSSKRCLPWMFLATRVLPCL